MLVVPIFSFVFLTLNWMTLTPKTQFAQFFPKVTFYFLFLWQKLVCNTGDEAFMKIHTKIKILGQLSTGNWHYCAVFVKSVRFGRECKQSTSNSFNILRHFQDGRHWPWKLYMGQKLKHVPISLKMVSNCLSCHKDSKNV